MSFLRNTLYIYTYNNWTRFKLDKSKWIHPQQPSNSVSRLVTESHTQSISMQLVHSTQFFIPQGTCMATSKHNKNVTSILKHCNKAIINKFLDYHPRPPLFLRPPRLFLLFFFFLENTKILFCITIIIGFGIQSSIAILFTCSGAGSLPTVTLNRMVYYSYIH
jgi:hypothetical protein